ncbi:pyridoxal phosphate-dependent transferase [Umbelopsis sp. PMI_123]|nr:pyridoxal phosphate-dependent transferase [Umbelopsis sp. PMI_123]
MFKVITLASKTSSKATTQYAKAFFSSSSRSFARNKVLTIESMNESVKNVEYAVRGELALKAESLRVDLAQHKPLPFKRVIGCNIGNPQQLNQKPITFFRQVASLCENPDLLTPKNREALLKLYPQDAIDRAESLLKNCISVGAYSHSKGVPAIRKNVAKFIENRDGVPANPEHIFLTQGASSGVQTILQVITKDQHTGIMIPIPQYPLYSATLSLFNATSVPYYLDESNQWALNIKDMEDSVKQARSNGTDVRALCIINPGNPTGQCLSEENMRQVLDFCHRERIILLADEVYQTNIYQPDRRPFHSFKKILHQMGDQYKDVELVSFHSISKGMIGECGRRGGYFELVNIDDDVIDQIYKLVSANLCPNVSGQILVDLMTNPPQEGDESYPLYNQEISDIYESLKRRAVKLADSFNRMEGVTCNPAEGAMYVFPKITLPQKAIQAAKKAGKEPDNFYCLEMLDATGVCVVNGSGFGQAPNTWHLRSTFLPEEHLFDEFCDKLEKFHAQFLAKYKD